jgi:hypothetical protein
MPRDAGSRRPIRAVIDTIELGFVGEQVNPALFIPDQPL